MISIIGVLISLITPAVQSARAAARRLECLNNMKNLGLSVHNYASAHQDRIPPVHENGFPWCVALLPYLDNAALYREFKETDFQRNPYPELWLRVFTCPDDSDHHRQPGGLSYGVNMGYFEFRHNPDDPENENTINWIDDGAAGSGEFYSQKDRAITRSARFFWRRTSDGYVASLGKVSNGDGAGQTIMLGEKSGGMHPLWLSARGPQQWGKRDRDPDGLGSETMRRVAFGAAVSGSPASPPVSDPSVIPIGVGENTLQLKRPPDTPSSVHVQPVFGKFGPASGKATQPTSSHSGGLHFIFCDGRGKFVSTDIDQYVYTRLLTPDAGRWGEIPVSDNDF